MNIQPIELLSSATSTKTGVGFNFAKEYGVITNRTFSQFTVASVVTGSATAVSLDLEGSIDGTNWMTLLKHRFSLREINNGKSMFHVFDKPVTDVRAKLNRLSGGTNPTITIKLMGSDVR